MTNAATPEAWDATIADRLERATIEAGLSSAVGADAIGITRRFGFAIIDSTGAEPDAFEQRAAELHEFGSALGVSVIQSSRQEMVEDVKDYSDIESDDARGYRSGGELTAHSDPPTLILLHCLRAARQGGESSLVSVASIVERMTAIAPELVGELFEPFPTWRVEGQYGLPDAGPSTPRPVLAQRDGIVSCVIYRPFIDRAAEATGVALTPPQIAALDLFEECSMAEDLTLRFVLNPGQTLVLHNRTVLHARTDFVDWPELERRRHLLRMWIDAPEAFPVHPDHQLGDFFAPTR